MSSSNSLCAGALRMLGKDRLSASLIEREMDLFVSSSVTMVSSSSSVVSTSFIFSPSWLSPSIRVDPSPMSDNRSLESSQSLAHTILCTPSILCTALRHTVSKPSKHLSACMTDTILNRSGSSVNFLKNSLFFRAFLTSSGNLLASPTMKTTSAFDSSFLNCCIRAGSASPAPGASTKVSPR